MCNYCIRIYLHVQRMNALNLPNQACTSHVCCWFLRNSAKDPCFLVNIFPIDKAAVTHNIRILTYKNRKDLMKSKYQTRFSLSM